MVIGTACLFTFSFMLAIGGIDNSFGEDNKNSFYLVVYLVVPVLFFIFLPQLQKPAVRKTINIVTILVILYWSGTLLYMYGKPVDDRFFYPMSSVIGLAIHATLLFQWNLNFVLNKVENASLIVWVSTLATVILLLVFINTSIDLPLPFVCALPLVSGICCWWIENTENNNPISENSIQSIKEYDKAYFSTVEDPSRIKTLFFSVRVELSILFGIASGTFSSKVAEPESNDILAISIILIALLSILIPIVYFRRRPMPFRLIIVLPIIIVISIFSAFIGSDIMTFARIAVGVAWLVGHVLYFNQLPSYREMTKMDLIRFSYMEKIAAVLPFAITVMITQYIIEANAIYERFAAQVDHAVVFYMLMMAAIYGIALGRHLLLYFPRRPKAIPQVDLADELARIAAVTEKYSLTKRESEVLIYLSKGYSRLYIEKKLYISKGTAKTHIFHIFQKLGVSSQDDLIELVEDG